MRTLEQKMRLFLHMWKVAIRPSERSQAQRLYTMGFHFQEVLEKAKQHSDGKQIRGCQGLSVGAGEQLQRGRRKLKVREY